MEETDNPRGKILPGLIPQVLIEVGALKKPWTHIQSLTPANSWLDLWTPTQIKPIGGVHANSLAPFQTVETQLQGEEGMKIGQEEEVEVAAAAQKQSHDSRMKEKMTGVQRVRVVKGGAPHQGNLQVGHLLYVQYSGDQYAF